MFYRGHEMSIRKKTYNIIQENIHSPTKVPMSLVKKTLKYDLDIFSIILHKAAVINCEIFARSLFDCLRILSLLLVCFLQVH